VVGHDDEGVELVSFLIAVVGESFEEKVGIGFYLKSRRRLAVTAVTK
jgi:hypothetical protein